MTAVLLRFRDKTLRAEGGGVFQELGVLIIDELLGDEVVVAVLQLVGVDHHRLDELFADLDDGVERRKRVLEDHADLVAADAVEFVLRNAEEVLAFVDDLAAFDDGVFGQDAHDGLRGDGFARAGLADDAERLAAIKVEADAADRLDEAVVGAEIDDEVFDGEDFLALRLLLPFDKGKLFLCECHKNQSCPFNDGLNASLKPFPKRLNEIIMRAMMTDGKTIKYG